MIKVFTINLSFSTLYFIQENGKYLVVDAGIPGKTKTLKRKLAQKNINPADISLIILSHVHYDHVGNVSWLKEVSSAPVMVHKYEGAYLERGLRLIPNGATLPGKILSNLGKLYNPLPKFVPVKPDILVSDIVSLRDFGFSATVIPTPGHTSGSISIIFGSGESFVGDTCFSLYGSENIFPIFANDIPSLLKSWQTLIDSEANLIFPGHGKPIKKDELVKSYMKNRAIFV